MCVWIVYMISAVSSFSKYSMPPVRGRLFGSLKKRGKKVCADLTIAPIPTDYIGQTGFSQMLQASQNSATVSSICRQVYGLDRVAVGEPIDDLAGSVRASVVDQDQGVLYLGSVEGCLEIRHHTGDKALLVQEGNGEAEFHLRTASAGEGFRWSPSGFAHILEMLRRGSKSP